MSRARGIALLRAAAFWLRPFYAVGLSEEDLPVRGSCEWMILKAEKYAAAHP